MPLTVDGLIKQLAHHPGDAIVLRYDDGCWAELFSDAVQVVDDDDVEYHDTNGEPQQACNKPCVGVW